MGLSNRDEGEQRRLDGLRDAHSEVDHAALYLAAPGTPPDHPLRSERDRKNVPRPETGRARCPAVRLLFESTASVFPTRNWTSMDVLICRLPNGE